MATDKDLTRAPGSRRAGTRVKATASAVTAAVGEGLQLAASQRALTEVTGAVRALLGASYPKELTSTPVGSAVEAILVPAILHLLIGVVPGLPYSTEAQRVCELAMTSEAKDRLTGVLTTLVPSLYTVCQQLAASAVPPAKGGK